MGDLKGIWILETNGTVIFSYEKFAQGSEEVNVALFSGLIVSLEQFSNMLGEKKTERIEMGKHKFFISKDPENNLLFIIKTSSEANNKKPMKILNKLRKNFRDLFAETLKKYSIQELNLIIHDLFWPKVEEIFHDAETVIKEQFSEFFDSI